MKLLTFGKAVPRTVLRGAGYALGAVHRGLVFLWCLPVRVYRKFLSPLKGQGSCRFTPTCSRYFLDAVREWGIVIGTVLGVWRVIRCNPFSKGGSDPVPTRREASVKLRSLAERLRGKKPDGEERAGSPESRNSQTPEDGVTPRTPQSPTEN